MQTHLYIDGKGESARTYGDFAGVLAGPVARKYGYGLVYTLAFMVTGGYMLTLANSIQQIFYDVHLCLPVASLAAFALVLPGTQLRTLHLIAPHAMVSFVALLVVIAICLYFLLSDSASCDYEPPRSLNFWGAFNSVGSFVWSYSGVSYYPEMLAEMKRPQDFARKSLGFAIVAMTGLYALVSITTYATCGDGTPPSIVLVIPKGPWLRIASIFMVYHIIVAYLINSQVLIRGIVTACGWDKALEPGFQGRARWFAISTVFTALAYLIADVIPQFDNLNDLTGNVCCTQGCLILPPLFFFLVQRVAPWPDSACKTALTILGWPMIVSGIFLFFAGTTGSIMTIWQDAHADDSRRPFACQALS
ncbi:unnamed protein product [Polarella glacialis]|uniref:Amino acid transporter transmembrane domain-containing protein n=1 Tax=Polarella glacialis TaxID=89957 RepID=A0A813HFF0_POLGL|nr:unnamed protein product [Polarella glacialis]